MSMTERLRPEVPEETARVARASFPRGSLPIRVGDSLGPWCEDAHFAGLTVSGAGRGCRRHS